ncbi:MAG TPA: hypothetical protein PLA90_13775 [Candidatus Sumerlaeota bacterium]|nr:hypothetical protein [Candidatus Sumerlaeota bacterium]
MPTWKNHSHCEELHIEIVWCIAFLFLFSFTWNLCAQEGRVEDRLSEVMKAAREKKQLVDGSNLSLDEKTFSLLDPYLNDPDEHIRRQALSIEIAVVHSTTSTLIRQIFVERTLENDDRSLRILLSMGCESFSQKSKFLLGQKLISAEAEWVESQGGDRLKEERLRIRFNQLILCVGVAEDRDKLNLLEQIKNKYGSVFEDLDKKYTPTQKYLQEIENPWFDQPAWAALRARAMMGVKEDVEFCIKLVDEYPDNRFKAEVIFDDLEKITNRICWYISISAWTNAKNITAGVIGNKTFERLRSFIL